MRGVCWLGNVRYTQPLDPGQAKKWAALAALGHAMFVIGFSTDWRMRRFEQSARFYLLPHLPFAPLRYLVLLTLMPMLAFWLVVRGRAGILIAQSPYEGAVAAVAKFASRLFGRRAALIVESHGDFEESYFLYRKVPLQSVVRGAMKAISGVGLRSADVLRPVSSPTEQQLKRRAPGVPIERLIAWVDIDVFRDSPREVGLWDSHTILYAGLLVPLKGVHVLLQALHQVAKEFPKLRLELAGTFLHASYSEELHQLTAHLGLSERVTFLGHLKQDALARHLSRARVFVLPSFSEGLARVLIEAMAAGTPVIATRVGGLPDVVEDGVNGYLVPAGDVNALAEALRKIATQAQIQSMGERARARSQELFSTQAYVEGHRRMLARAQSILDA